jgi:predicted transcriptional regulator
VSAPLYSVTRAERAAEAVRLRAEGLSARQIAEALGVSRSYASLLYTDPDGTREAKRRERYGRECEDCGTRTFGGNGAAKAPKLCVACTNKRREPEHGTLSRYEKGCACDPCRAANRAHHRSLLGKKPPTHGASGYSNYGCRCRVCRNGKLVYDRSKGYEHQRAYRQRRKASA